MHSSGAFSESPAPAFVPCGDELPESGKRHFTGRTGTRHEAFRCLASVFEANDTASGRWVRESDPDGLASAAEADIDRSGFDSGTHQPEAV